METNVKLDVVKFLRTTLADMRGDIDYAYPKDVFDEGVFEEKRGHTALQMIGSKIEALSNFLDALEPKPETEMPPLPELPAIERRAADRV